MTVCVLTSALSKQRANLICYPIENHQLDLLHPRSVHASSPNSVGHHHRKTADVASEHTVCFEQRRMPAMT
ncbi:hypothetical protein LshimejAT787_0601540 [Lyophyllum shimeji]|uniref:Uncharacterized protein n=1 Tax=Lyophyllum shimeji TaxID=47721 RepID=A0A9P3PMC7_LYOSH|nr:hypothetical protein LshimejAT787_0601540 [Lyophyllum shimeji]